MNDAARSDAKLVWKDEYSVNVKVIDDQHKRLFTTINELIDLLDSIPTKEQVSEIVNQIVEYKMSHFATEEKYFHLFNYDGTKMHEDEHRKFNTSLQELQKKYEGDVISFAFALIDFLEDWLIGHLMTVDQQYKQCFHDHGLT